MRLWKGIAWNEAICMAWLLLWRSLLLAFVSGFPLGVIGSLLGVPTRVVTLLAAIIGFAIINPHT